MESIDITFDTRSDSGGVDPDKASKTLKRYHLILWEKELPNGIFFSLNAETKNNYLFHKSVIGEFNLTSDTIIHTYSRWKRTQNLIRNVNLSKIEEFRDIGRTIGGYIIFPGNKIDNLNTINQERGTNKLINDRFDLTLECIKRFYNDDKSPLYRTLKRYSNFFMLFKSFKGYCEFFLLNDLVNKDFDKIKFFMSFSDFGDRTIPKDVNEYEEYRTNCIQFVKKRNQRILNL
jgi:hypothetical protein